MKLETFIRAALTLLQPRRAPRADRTPTTPARPRPSGQHAGQRQGEGGDRSASQGAAGAAGGISTYDVARLGAPSLAYAPNPDGDADPGEVVWGWVPYEEDSSQGKDRPLLIVGSLGRDLVGVQLTSKDHSRDLARESARGRRWLDVGSGGWDRQGRESEARIDRVLLVDPRAVRREGATLARSRFDDVARALREHHGW